MTKRFKFTLAAAALIAGAGGLILAQRSDSKEVTYREVIVKKSDIEVRILSTGTVGPENRLAIRPPVAGRIEQVLVKEGETVKRGQILAWMSSTERAALLDAARADGEAAVKRWEKNYKPTPILAPIDGTIILRSVETGQTFANTDSVFTMSDRLTIKALVDETDIGQVKVGQVAQVTLDAYPDKEIEAVVEQIAFDAVTTNNVTTYQVTVIPKHVPEFMRSGMTANVHFLTVSRHDITVVPNEALKFDAGKHVVLIKGEGKQMENLPVDTGLTDGKFTEVTSDLAIGTKIYIPEAKSTKAAKSSNPFLPTPPRRKR